MLPPAEKLQNFFGVFLQFQIGVDTDSVRGGVIIGLGSRLQVFQSELIRKITSFDEIDLELPAKEKCAFFCITSDQDATFDFLSSLFFSCLFIKLVRYADSVGKGGRCDIPVNFILDEHPNSGLILDFNKKISVTCSRAISVSVIFQNLAQMKNRYPNDVWQEIIGNCDVQIALGCTDEATAKFLSDRTGEITIGVQSTARQLSSWQVSSYTPQYRETSGLGRRKLMTMDEILRMPLDQELVIIRGHNVLQCEKFDYSLHSDAQRLVKSRASEYIPAWRAEEEQAKKVPVLESPEEKEVEKPEGGVPDKPVRPRKKYRKLEEAP